MNIILNWVILSAIFLVASYLLPSVQTKGFLAAMAAALVLAIFNVFVKPLLLFLTLPINILTLGLFTLVINALLVLAVSALVPGFDVGGFWSALFFSVLITIFSYIVNTIFK